MSKKQNNIFSKGYSQVHKQLKKNPIGIQDCSNCQFFDVADGEKYEMCHNVNVTKWDMVQTEYGEYCSYWQPINSDDMAKTIENTIDKQLGKNLSTLSRRFTKAQRNRMRDLL